MKQIKTDGRFLIKKYPIYPFLSEFPLIFVSSYPSFILNLSAGTIYGNNCIFI